MIPFLIALALLSVPAPSISFHISTHCPRKVVENKSILQELRLKTIIHKFFHAGPARYINSYDPNLQTIVDGSRANKRRYPWVALIVILDGDKKPYEYCTGVAISDSVMLTASHCVPLYYKHLFFVMMGLDERNNYLAGDVVGFVDNSHVFKEGHFKEISRDIAIFPYRTKNSSKPPKETQGSYPTLNRVSGWIEPDTECIALGFGVVDFKNRRYRTFLQKVSVRVIEDDYPHLVYTTDGGAKCAGDSGGAILCNRRGHLYLVGIITGNKGNQSNTNTSCHNNTSTKDSEVVGMAAKITEYYGWLSQIRTKIHDGTFYDDRTEFG